MNISLRTLIDSKKALDELVSLKLDATDSFDLLKSIKAINEEMKIFNEARDITVKKYSSNGIKVDEDKLSAFIEEINLMGEKEVTIPDYKLSQEKLLKCQVSTALLLQLAEWLIDMK